MSIRDDYITVAEWWEWSAEDKAAFKKFASTNREEADDWARIEAEACRLWISRGYNNAAEFLDIMKDA